MLRHLSEAQRRALVIADNGLALNAGWDEEMLRIELTALQSVDFNLDLTGFAEQELVRLLAEQQALVGLTDEDAAPALPEVPVTIAGDLWILGSHKLLVGDATVAADVERLMSSDSADLVFTDPPYNVDYEGYTEDKLKIRSDRVSDVEFRHSSEPRSDRIGLWLKLAPPFMFATRPPGSANFKTHWRRLASRSALR